MSSMNQFVPSALCFEFYIAAIQSFLQTVDSQQQSLTRQWAQYKAGLSLQSPSPSNPIYASDDAMA